MTRKLKAQIGTDPTLPGISSRRNTCGLKKSTFNLITKQDLVLRPYYLQESQDIHAPTWSPEERVAWCERQLALIEADPEYQFTIIWTDEAGLTVNGKKVRQLSQNFVVKKMYSRSRGSQHTV